MTAPRHFLLNLPEIHNAQPLLTALAVAAVVPVASAADTTPAKLELKGAYLYLDHNAASGQKFVRVVFRTAGALPRRYDGMLQAGVKIEGVGHSLGSARRGANIYTGATEIKGGSIATVNGDNKVVRKGAKLGRKFTVTVETRDGQKVTRKLTLRAERKGDDSGRPLVK